MPPETNMVILSVTATTITLMIDGKPLEIPRNPETLRDLLESKKATSIQIADKIVNIGSITTANFNFIVDQTQNPKSLPSYLVQNLITEDNLWVESLRQEIKNQGAVVGNTALSVFQHYGWLIEVFLQKMETEVGKERTLRRLAFMAEAYQSTLRYLCYVQLAQLLKRESTPRHPAFAQFFQMEGNQHDRCDCLILLLLTTESLGQEESFMPEINKFVADLCDTQSDLYNTALFLEANRNALLNNAIPADQALDQLLDEYLTGLVSWLRELAFLARYRLVSIKDIHLSYRLGSHKNFVHVYGELHGMFTEADGRDYNEKAVRETFTYNQSVLLFKGSEMGNILDHIHDPNTFLSLSPLVIDQSVYAAKPTQTPEIYYFIGQATGRKEFRFAHYKNELATGDTPISTNKELPVAKQNTLQPKLNELHTQLEQLLSPFKTEKR